MPKIPKDNSIDSTLSILRDGYRFISKRARRLQSDVFETRLGFQNVVCTTGEEAARAFYVSNRFTREESMPPTTLKLLQDKGSVQMQDGPAHRRRKQMFMSFMAPDDARLLAARVTNGMSEEAAKWVGAEAVVLLPAVESVLYRVVAEWAGIPYEERHSKRRTRELHAMVDGAGSVGPRNLRGHILRARTERWARNLIGKVRDGAVDPPSGSALAVIAQHRSEEGALLDEEVAAVELINVLRPVVAIAYFITFSALALHEHPNHRSELREGDEPMFEAFVHEVRRFYPFFPFIAGRVREPYEWSGYRFDRGRMVLLDIYGTHHDPRLWAHANRFDPGRFIGAEQNAYSLIPQGGGNHLTNHRCAGEWITIEIMKAALRVLTQSIEYDVPEQDLSIPMSRMPTFPKSRFVMRNVQPAA